MVLVYTLTTDIRDDVAGRTTVVVATDPDPWKDSVTVVVDRCDLIFSEPSVPRDALPLLSVDSLDFACPA